MRRLTFFCCPTCGSILTATGRPELYCCGRRLEPLAAQPADGEHRLTLTPSDGESYVTFAHPMEKAHFLSFAEEKSEFETEWETKIAALSVDDRRRLLAILKRSLKAK